MHENVVTNQFAVRALTAEAETLIISTAYSLYREKLVRLAVKMGLDKQSALDVVHDVFEVIWMRRDTLEGIRMISSYLYRAVVYKVFDYKDHEKKARVREQRAAQEETYHTRIVANLTARLNALKEVYSRLPKRQQEVLLLKMEDLTHKEIAEKLNMSIGNVKYHLDKCYKKLRKEALQNRKIRPSDKKK